MHATRTDLADELFSSSLLVLPPARCCAPRVPSCSFSHKLGSALRLQARGRRDGARGTSFNLNKPPPRGNAGEFQGGFGGDTEEKLSWQLISSVGPCKNIPVSSRACRTGRSLVRSIKPSRAISLYTEGIPLSQLLSNTCPAPFSSADKAWWGGKHNSGSGAGWQPRSFEPRALFYRLRAWQSTKAVSAHHM